MYVQQAKPANAARTPISTMLMGISESGFDYPPTNERRCAFQSRMPFFANFANGAAGNFPRRPGLCDR
jgi:hypothetical protein